EQEVIREKKLLDRFMREVVKGGLAAYGLDDIRAAIAAKKVETLIVSEGLSLQEFRMKCRACGRTFMRIAEKPPEEECPCGGKPVVESESDIVGEVISAAEAQALPIEMVSQNTAEGSQFYATFKGLGAFLRYK
ncbi:MAG: peptide chain release factor 1, partial [Candidatus Micrarchaeota archaeon]